MNPASDPPPIQPPVRVDFKIVNKTCLNGLLHAYNYVSNNELVMKNLKKYGNYLYQ